MTDSDRPPDSANAAPTSLDRAQSLLLDFLHEFDANAIDPPDCPVCNYNLQNLTRPFCPECGHELVLTVGAARLGLGWLMAAVAPGFFSGIAAAFLLVPILGRLIFGDGRLSITLNVLDLFGWCSGIFAILLARRRARARFLKMPRHRQKWFAITVWAIHLLAFAMLLLIGPRYI